MENEIRKPFSLMDFCYIIFRHKVRISIIFLTTVFTVIVGIYFWPEHYEARARILIKMGRENVSLSTVSLSAQQQIITSMGIRKEDINSEIEILNNRFIIDKVVQKLGTDFLFPTAKKPETLLKRIKFELKQVIKGVKDFVDQILYKIALKKKLSDYEKAVLLVQKSLSAKQVRNSDVIEVQFRWFDPNISKEVVGTLIDSYLEHHLEVHRTSGEQEFFRNQVEIIGDRLRDSEDKLQVLKESQGITSYEDQKRFLLRQITNFKATLKNTQTELGQTITKISKLKNQQSSIDRTIELTKQVNRNPMIDPLKTRLLELELKMKELETKYSDDNHLVNKIRNQIQEVKDRLKEEEAEVFGAVTTGVNTVYKEIEKELLLQEVRLRALSSKKEMLEQHIESYTKDLETINTYDIELKRLNRQIQIDDENFRLYRKRMEEARIYNVLDNERIVNVKVIDPVAASFMPVGPRKLLIVGLGVVLSLVIGIGLAFLSEYLDDSIKTVEDVERYLKLPVLGSIRES